ncbi:Mak10 subunit, NatC N-terminal acetyltransferase-domain-containing protein [Epithele typhae]|uniref:Mak10 subunit, NatC N-terminal acetyltransferase-domain-containing protein n=1 Tax=Epithele typhae TaxID=378194 RepID=UPI0020078993|nr:Mak10 subunit, NatC N-terminal acetyltransferase-domain-containing protein [Epithele typhae]KAH9915240.1 Mak10 subunit, NatC N-terminal acetyltransferase-domain-containing protein [Epithele typhae]
MSDFDDWFDMPSGDDFEDVTGLFVTAGQEMEPEEVILMDGMTLMDAMSAFEIGEPRLDSGMILEEQRRPPFDPLAPLLPEEVCWILDRTFACEMEWHSGKTLSQSVFTILFVHHLPDINPEYLIPEDDEDPARPRWLITIVLRAGVLGMLKCCDLAWRELSKNRVQDIEDWQGEKCDVSLLEGINTSVVLHMLDIACDWVRQSNLSPQQVSALCDRLALRKALMELYKLEPLREVENLPLALAVAQGLIHRVRSLPQELPQGSSALLVMDPYIARRLPNFMPIRVTEMPPPNQSWDVLQDFVEYWVTIGQLVTSPSLLKWKVRGDSWIALNREPPAAFHRSSLQSLFFDSGFVLGSHRTTWLLERYFYEALGTPYSTILAAFERSAPYMQKATMRDVIERRIVKLMVPHIRSSWYNPPRRRRHLMKEVLQWHMLYDVMLKDVDQHRPPDADAAAILKAIPQTALMRRLSACREVILSGFQQELYAPDEKPIAYWRLANVLEAHLDCIERLLLIVPPGTMAHHELIFQSQHLAALQMISVTLVPLTANCITSPWSRIALNFMRRYKWLFAPQFNDLVPAEPVADLTRFPQQLDEAVRDLHYSPSETFKLAQNILSRLSESPQEWVGHSANGRREYLQKLADVCENLTQHTPRSQLELPNFNHRTLKWIPEVHPWFPTVPLSS